MLLITCRISPKSRFQKCDMLAHSGLQVNKDSSRDIMLIVSLIKEYIFAVAAFRCPFLKNTVFVDPMFGT